MKIKLFLTFLVAMGLFGACRKDLLDEKVSNSEEVTANPQSFIFGNNQLAEGLMELGRKLENPYSVTNMQLAYEALSSKFPDDVELLDIRVTHRYIKFLPQTEKEHQLLESIQDIELFEYPLDYEIKKQGVYYRDPTISEGMPNPQYASIPIDFPLPSVDYEVIEELYIPEEVESESLLGTVTALVDQSLVLTNNLVDNILQISFRRPKKWNPDGFIRAFDNELNSLIPLQGVKVRAVRWFTTKVSYTDSRGYYKTGTFRRPVNYSIKWENDSYWDIRKGLIGQAKYDGPKQKGRWNLDIQSWAGESLGFATIHRALYRYFYKNIAGLKRPGNRSKLKVSYHHGKSGTGVNWGNWDGTGLFPTIRIWGKNSSGNDHAVNQLYSTMIHEIAHTSHLELIGNIQYIQVSKTVYESWANAVEFYITRLEYNDLGEVDYDNPVPFNDVDNMQSWVGGDPDYTPLFIDFIDNYNQSIRRGTVASSCPDGGVFDGNCYIGTPPQGETSFIYADNFYYTPVNCCDCPLPGSWYDGANCFVQDIPDNRIGFIWNNNWYLRPAGDEARPYDEISGYTMFDLEQRILPHSYGLTSLRSKLKEFKPNGMTDKHIDLYFNYYYN